MQIDSSKLPLNDKSMLTPNKNKLIYLDIFQTQCKTFEGKSQKRLLNARINEITCRLENKIPNQHNFSPFNKSTKQKILNQNPFLSCYPELF